jgi:hypothetical protein
MAVLCGILAGVIVKADYVQTGPSSSTMEDDYPDSNTATMEEYSDLDTVAQDWGFCQCYASTRCWAAAVDSAYTNVLAAAYWEVSWEWEGPPSTPPGGSLYWEIYSNGITHAWGETDPGDGGSAHSEAEAYSLAWDVHGGVQLDGGVGAYGDVEDDDLPASPESKYWLMGSASYADPYDWLADNGYYSFLRGWQLDGHGDQEIASGTSYIQVFTGVGCSGETSASAGGAGSGSEALAQTYTLATAYLEADLTSN